VGRYDQVFTARSDGTHVRQLTHLTQCQCEPAVRARPTFLIAFVAGVRCAARTAIMGPAGVA